MLLLDRGASHRTARRVPVKPNRALKVLSSWIVTIQDVNKPLNI